MITYYWYKRCSTCLKAKAWLDQEGIEYDIIDMVEKPPTKEQFVEWINNNDLPLRRYFNTSGQVYRKEGLKDKIDGMSVEEAAERLSQNGLLIKRPLIIHNGKVILGFKESEYEQLK